MLVGPQQAGVGKNSRPKQKLDIYTGLYAIKHIAYHNSSPQKAVGPGFANI